MNPLQNKQRVAVIGLGLIGGSAARCLAKRYDVIGYDSDENTINTALETGVLTEGYTAFNQALSNCQIVYLAAPVQICCNICKDLPVYINPDTIVTDLCSTKQEMIACAMKQKLRFVGGHPMAGSEQKGFSASHVGLMENAYYLVVPPDTTDLEAIDLITEIAQNLFHAIPLVLSPQEHDKAVGLISHLPHVLSASLVNLVRKADTSEHLLQKIAAGGFRDITRISSSDPQLWDSICNSNQAILIDLLDQTILELSAFSKRLHEKQSVTDLFQSAKTYRDEIESGIKNEQGYELLLDVADKPGVIGQIAILLGEEKINITNINISNSREFEGGVLRVRIKRQEDVARATQLLKQNGYDVKKK